MPALRHFQQLSEQISKHRAWWQLRPFELLHSPWEALNPRLNRALSALSNEQLCTLEQSDVARAQWLNPFLGWSETLLALTQLPSPPQAQTDAPGHWQRDIPGKKWQQIQAFSPFVPPEGSILEWCAGKGHLGRYISLSHQQQSVTSLEWQQSLCDAGSELAARHQVPQRFFQQDVFQSDTTQHLNANQHAIALHACGDLHRELVRQVCAQQLQGVSLSPCCYHLIRGEHYQPMSQEGKRADFSLSKDDLSMCLRQTVTAGKRERQQRHTELHWRLAFDCYQRQLRKCNAYLPLPTVPKSLLKGSFANFIRWCCDTKSLSFNPQISLDECLEQGSQRVRVNREIELVQHCFQRPIEIWLALDKVLYLQEQGYRAQLQTFCDFQLTPRNLILTANR